jgi:hypothetical protein
MTERILLPRDDPINMDAYLLWNSSPCPIGILNDECQIERGLFWLRADVDDPYCSSSLDSLGLNYTHSTYKWIIWMPSYDRPPQGK